MLHHVGDAPLYDSLKPYAISQKSFLRLINFLERKNILTTTFAELAGSQVWPKRQVILTFDDCSKSLFDFAIPELLKRNMKAVFYMPTAHIGQCNSWDVAEGRSQLELMNELDLRTLVQCGMEIGGHSHHHVKLNQLSAPQIQQEIHICSTTIAAITQQSVFSFAYPYGAVPEKCDEILENLGIGYALGIFVPKETRFALRRFIYHDGDSDWRIALKMSIIYRLYRQISDRFK